MESGSQQSHESRKLQLIRVHAVIQRLACGRTYFYKHLSENPDFPASIRIGRARMYRESDIEDWVNRKFEISSVLRK